MDLDLYQQLIRRYWPVFLGIVVLTVIGAWLFTERAATSPSYVATQFIGVAQRPQEQAADQYQYGEFYNVQGSAYLAEFLAGWLQDPATIQRVYEDAGVAVPTTSLRTVNRSFELKLQGRSGLQMVVERVDGTEAKALLAAASATIQQKLRELQGQGIFPEVVLIPGEIAVGPTLPNLTVNLAVGLVAGIILGFLALLGLSVTLPRR